MKEIANSKYLPLGAAVLGGAALVLRWLLYAVAVDEKGLLPVGHPLEMAVWVVTALALLYILVMVWRLDGSDLYEDNFSASQGSCWGHIAAGAAILWTVMGNVPLMPGRLGGFWQLLGYASPVCLAWAGSARRQGKQPFFALHLVPCLFLVMHIVNYYQTWSGNPQLQDYFFTLFGTMALMFFAFYTTAFDVGGGKRRMQLGMGLAAVYLLTAELATSDYPWLYLGGIVWAWTDLCTLYPKPKPEPEEAAGTEAGKEG